MLRGERFSYPGDGDRKQFFHKSADVLRRTIEVVGDEFDHHMHRAGTSPGASCIGDGGSGRSHGCQLFQV